MAQIAFSDAGVPKGAQYFKFRQSTCLQTLCSSLYGFSNYDAAIMLVKASRPGVLVRVGWPYSVSYEKAVAQSL